MVARPDRSGRAFYFCNAASNKPYSQLMETRQIAPLAQLTSRSLLISSSFKVLLILRKKSQRAIEHLIPCKGGPDAESVSDRN